MCGEPTGEIPKMGNGGELKLPRIHVKRINRVIERFSTILCKKLEIF